MRYTSVMWVWIWDPVLIFIIIMYFSIELSILTWDLRPLQFVRRREGFWVTCLLGVRPLSNLFLCCPDIYVLGNFMIIYQKRKKKQVAQDSTCAIAWLVPAPASNFRCNTNSNISLNKYLTLKIWTQSDYWLLHPHTRIW